MEKMSRQGLPGVLTGKGVHKVRESKRRWPSFALSSHRPIHDSSLELPPNHFPILTALGIESPTQELAVRGHNQTKPMENLGKDGEAERGGRMGGRRIEKSMRRANSERWVGGDSPERGDCSPPPLRAASPGPPVLTGGA